jgi:probable F420-dependent oxidoreductase
MTPFFSPGPNPWGPPPIFLAAVGAEMLRTAGEVADGLLVHPFTTPLYLREVILPALEQALATAGRRRDEFKISVPLFVVTGDSDAEVAAADGLVRRQIAFYGSTPAYRRVLDLHGWGDLQSELHPLSKRGSWEEMTKLIDDTVLDTFAVVGTPAELPSTVLARYSGVADRIALPPTALEQAWGPGVVAELRKAP